MKFFILMLVLQHALGQCPEWAEHMPDIPCGPDELSCPLPPHPDFPDCQFPNTCIPTGNDMGCPDPSCPVVCSDDEFICREYSDDWYCPPKEICVPRQPNCPGVCPVTCDPVTEEHCPNGDPSGSPPECEPQALCLYKGTDWNGDLCRPSICPVTCGSEETMCPGGVDEVGCPTPPTCMPVDPNSDCKPPCPITCSPHEHQCPGGIDYDGCPEQGYCMSKERGYDGEECPSHCYQQCKEDEVYCPGTRDANGCSSPDTCNSIAINQNGGRCPAICPMTCGPDEMLCPGGIDCVGCPMGDICISVEGNVAVFYYMNMLS